VARASGGTGLHRVFSIAGKRGWKISFDGESGSVFEVATPDLRAHAS